MSLTTRTDAQVIARLERGGNNREMAALWRGDSASYPSVSAADVALCTYLALANRNDLARIDALFRQSGRYRDDWHVGLDHSANGSSASDGALTIIRAIEACDGRARAIERTLALSPGNVTDTFNQTASGNAEYFVARWGHAVRRDCAEGRGSSSWIITGRQVRPDH